MEKTVNTAWYARKCALGVLACCVAELALLMLSAALTLRGVIGEEMLNRLVLIFAAIAVFLGCAVGAGRTSKRVMLTVCCAAASWLVMQVTGILAYGELLPERSLQTAAAMAAGAAASLLMKNGKKMGRGNKVRARRGRR